MTWKIMAFVFMLMVWTPAVLVHADSFGKEGPPALRFDSVFERYRSYEPQFVAPWRQSNDRVGDVGGWRTYSREASEPEDSGAQPTGSDAPHSGHEHGSAP